LSNVTEGRWSRDFKYDQYGNMWTTGSNVSTQTPSTQDWIDAGTNRLSTTQTSVAYDAAGNLTQAGATQFGFDGENRLNTATTTGTAAVTYSYDGNGRRVMKSQGAIRVVSVYDIFGALAAEYHSDAAVTPACSTFYLSADQVGSTRLITDGSANTVAWHDLYPFGEDMGTSNGRGDTGMPNAGWGRTDNVRRLFTGQERDEETGLDFFQARYFSSLQGRFTSPDPFNAGADRPIHRLGMDTSM
jgi:RHS repeat-associated protein